MPNFYNPENCRNEKEVETKFIVYYLLPALGYPPESWFQEVTLGRFRLDFLVLTEGDTQSYSPYQLVLEAKSPSQNLDRHVRKFKRYLSSFDACYGLLTNGKLVRIYASMGGEFKLVFEAAGRDLDNKIDQVRQIIGRETLLNLPQPVRTEPNTGNNSQDNQTNSKEMEPMKVIAIYHNKGGVGKTTTVVNLAAALSKRGKKVLVIDLDSQANTTYALGLIKFDDDFSDNIKGNYVYHVIREKNKYPISEVVRRSSFTNPEVDVLPAHIDLMQHEKELTEVDAARTRLLIKLQSVKDKYDVVLIDTPPSLNLYSKIALISTDYLIIPSDLKTFANEGLKNVRNFIDENNEFRALFGKPPIQLLGVLPCKLNTHARFVQFTLPKMVKNVKDNYGFELMQSRIFERRDVSAAIEQTIPMGDLDIPNPQSILDYDPNSEAAAEFDALATEVLMAIGL